MVYGLERNAYYIQSADNGRTFTKPAKVNTTGSVETKMGERGPKVAVGLNGAIHVVWVDAWAPGVKTYVRYSRSLDGGRTFEAPTTNTLIRTACGLFRTLVAMMAPGSAKALGRNLRCRPRPVFKIAVCDLRR